MSSTRDWLGETYRERERKKDRSKRRGGLADLLGPMPQPVDGGAVESRVQEIGLLLELKKEKKKKKKKGD